MGDNVDLSLGTSTLRRGFAAAAAVEVAVVARPRTRHFHDAAGGRRRADCIAWEDGARGITALRRV